MKLLKPFAFAIAILCAIIGIKALMIPCILIAVGILGALWITK